MAIDPITTRLGPNMNRINVGHGETGPVAAGSRVEASVSAGQVQVEGRALSEGITSIIRADMHVDPAWTS